MLSKYQSNRWAGPNVLQMYENYNYIDGGHGILLIVLHVSRLIEPGMLSEILIKQNCIFYGLINAFEMLSNYIQRVHQNY